MQDEEIFKQRQRDKYQREIRALKRYALQLGDSMTTFQRAVNEYEGGERSYTKKWKGRSNDGYTLIDSEIKAAKSSVITKKGQLVAEVYAEISRLQEKVAYYS
ncbi:hypothetical protein [Aquibacillus kalidii]|uniref:hypothetical protein n=1 Tax=Aquibacillus kalidii TaxID=2762597 RepID=UPI001644F1BD|nr:hypothetical protein [Aquibacillus kalidii]